MDLYDFLFNLALVSMCLLNEILKWNFRQMELNQTIRFVSDMNQGFHKICTVGP